MTGPAVAAIGAELEVQGFSLAGALVRPAHTDAEVLAAWQSLPAEVSVVVLTAAAARAVPARRAADRPLTVVLPT